MFRHFRRCVGKPRVHTEEKEKFTAENKRNLHGMANLWPSAELSISKNDKVYKA